MALRLVPLDCPACGSALTGDQVSVLLMCSHCGSGAVIGASGLERIEGAALLPAPGRRAERWLPGWEITVTVQISDRVRADGRRTEDRREERVFVIPAFDLTLSDMERLARAMVAAVPSSGTVPREPIGGGSLGLEDALTFVRFLVVGEEARRADLLASVSVGLHHTRGRLLAMPFEDAGKGRLRCAVTGVEIGLDAEGSPSRR